MEKFDLETYNSLIDNCTKIIKHRDSMGILTKKELETIYDLIRLARNMRDEERIKLNK